MALRTWKNDASNSFANDTTRWDAALVNGDDGLIAINDYDRTTSLTSLGSVNVQNFTIGKGVRRSIGTVAQAMTFGTCTGTLRVNAPLSTSIFVAPTAFPRVVIEGCSQNENGFRLSGGSVTNIVIDCDGMVRIGLAATITGDIELNRGTLVIESGATVSSIIVSGGALLDYSGGWSDCVLAGGTYRALGDSALSLGKFTISGGNHEIIAPCTIVAINGNGGPSLLDFSRDARRKVVTNANLLRGFTLNAGGSYVEFTNMPRIKGGLLKHAQGVYDVMEGA